MGQVIVTTGWNDKGYPLYGKSFADTFAEFWPSSYQLFAYTESHVELPRGSCRSLWLCPGVRAFIKRHEENQEARGAKENAKWSLRQRGRGYNFRFDAVKFCRQMFIPAHAASCASFGDVIVWLDGDVLTTSQAPGSFVEDTLGDADLCYLGRKDYHSELGFWACRVNAGGLSFLQSLADMYRRDKVFELAEWHSAWVFDHCRSIHELQGLKVKNLTPGGHGHVWFQSSLGNFSDHLKGARKQLGASPERRKSKRK